MQHNGFQVKDSKMDQIEKKNARSVGYWQSLRINGPVLFHSHIILVRSWSWRLFNIALMFWVYKLDLSFFQALLLSSFQTTF